MSSGLKITQTLEYFIAKVKRFAEQTERGDFDYLTAAEFSDRLLLVQRRAKSAIHGISILLIKSGMVDPDDDMHYSREIMNIAQNATVRFEERKQQKEN
jgi:hypothetical protein